MEHDPSLNVPMARTRPTQLDLLRSDIHELLVDLRSALWQLTGEVRAVTSAASEQHELLERQRLAAEEHARRIVEYAEAEAVRLMRESVAGDGPRSAA